MSRLQSSCTRPALRARQVLTALLLFLLPPLPRPAAAAHQLGRTAFSGGAVYVDAAPTIERNLIRSNHAADVGGVYVDVNGTPLILSNVLTQNTGTSGALYLGTGSDPSVINNTFFGNDSMSCATRARTTP